MQGMWTLCADGDCPEAVQYLSGTATCSNAEHNALFSENFLNFVPLCRNIARWGVGGGGEKSVVHEKGFSKSHWAAVGVPGACNIWNNMGKGNLGGVAHFDVPNSNVQEIGLNNAMCWSISGAFSFIHSFIHYHGQPITHLTTRSAPGHAQLNPTKTARSTNPPAH